MNILNFLSQYSDGFFVITTFLGVIVSVCIGLLPLRRVSKEKSLELRIQNFKLLQEMIRCLDNLDKKNPIGLSEQEAIVFELRNYPEYKVLIVETLRKRLVKWEKDDKYTGLVENAKDTMLILK